MNLSHATNFHPSFSEAVSMFGNSPDKKSMVVGLHYQVLFDKLT